MTNKIAVLACADFHSNSSVAVCPPIVNLDEGGTYRSSRVQRWLWEVLTDVADRFSKVEADKKVGLFIGDMGELDTMKRSNQLVSFNKDTALKIAIANVEPIISLTDDDYYLRGTPAHTGKSSWFEETLARDNDGSVPQGWAKNHLGEKEKSPASWYHIRIVFSGVRFDIAHHASMGRLPHTEKHAALKMVEKAMWRYAIDMQQPLPHVMIRAHNHKVSDSGGNYRTYGVTLPSLSAATEYVHRIGAENDKADVGAILFICENGKFVEEKWLYEAQEVKRVWTLKG